MAIRLNIYKDGEKISNLTEHSIQLINFTGSINRPVKPNINDLIDGVVLKARVRIG